MDWSEKYRPQSLSEVRGNNKSVEKLKEWAEEWGENGKPALVHGRPGVGKTSSLYALADDKGWEVVELNASDKRTAKSIENIVEASISSSLAGKKRLLILDEADNLHGNADRGGAKAVSNLVEDSKQPIALVANDTYEIPRSLRNKCKEIKFRNVGKRSIVPVLRYIREQEGLDIKEKIIEEIAEKNSGDLRGAINDFQATVEGKNIESNEKIATSQRDTEEDIFSLLNLILKDDSDLNESLVSIRNIDETPRQLLKWIDENISKVYSEKELKDGYNFLSRSSIYLNRTQETQDYSFWRYAGAMLAGVGTAKKETKGGWTSYSPPSWSSKGTNTAERKIAKEETINIKNVRELLPYIKLILEKGNTSEIISSLGFSVEEVKEITGWKKDKIRQKIRQNKPGGKKSYSEKEEAKKETKEEEQSNLSEFE